MLFAIFNVAGIVIEVELQDFEDWNGPGGMEVRTRFTAIVEGEYVTWSRAQVLYEYATQKEMQDAFQAECDKYRFINRTNKESE